MKTITIYHNPHCSKSKAALQQLESINAQSDKPLCAIEIKAYLTTDLTKEDVKTLLHQFSADTENPPFQDLIRAKETEFQAFLQSENLDINTQPGQLSEQQVCQAIVNYPILLQRPVIVLNNKAIIARDDKSLQRISQAIKSTL